MPPPPPVCCWTRWPTAKATAAKPIKTLGFSRCGGHADDGHRARFLNPLPPGERVARRAGEGVVRVPDVTTRATPSP
ncbi:hypothetical protein D9623_02005 [Azospirillum brasilense]|uniref:Uncharacterized protein n=1 Tax=Azospirillum brasilense TaxID=192 RepID=A0A4D8QEE3_AZOBR|nr:hypothetical protein [Azospirillum brasilense]QCO09035.1 hypothetical protein D3868_08285 [Azospirillum brasilense]QEL95254.1 hypothetical protein D9623_02005 [Azospirillum brasilense]